MLAAAGRLKVSLSSDAAAIFLHEHFIVPRSRWAASTVTGGPAQQLHVTTVMFASGNAAIQQKV
jgi:hypothetical protein